MTDQESVPVHRLHPVAHYVTQGPPSTTGDWRYVRPIFRAAVPPCIQGCPATLNVREYTALALEGKMEEAWRLVKKDNPIPAVTGRVCYHPCEQQCNRAEFDEPVAIHAIERHIGDYGLEKGLQVSPAARREETVAVVGSGPAGLSTAYHLVRRGYGVTVFESAGRPGGMLRDGIPAYRLPRDVLDGEIDGLKSLGIEFVTNARVGDQVAWADLKEYAAVFLGAGCPASLGLDVPRVGLEGVVHGLSFLRAVNGGRSVEVGEKVLVIGGGNVAVDVGRTAVRLGARDVTLVFPESMMDMPAHPEERQAALDEGITLQSRTHVLRFAGDGGRVTGAECEKLRSFEFDPAGNLTVDPMPDSRHVLEAGLCVVSIGQTADYSFLPPALLENDAELRSGEPVRLGSQWVLAGGDMVSGPASVIDAIGAGKRAATALDAIVRGGAPPRMDRAMRHVAYGDLNLTYFKREERWREPALALDSRLGGFAEVVGALDRASVVAEAGRCFYCGDCNLCGNCWLFCPEMSIALSAGGDAAATGLRFEYPEIDLATCKGCGICLRECPRSALVVEEEIK